MLTGLMDLKKKQIIILKKDWRILDKMIELDQIPVQDFHLYYHLAAIHAFQGDKDKAYENLRIVKSKAEDACLDGRKYQR